MRKSHGSGKSAMKKMDGFELLSDDSVPLYQRLKNSISARIESREWLPGEAIPSENQFCDAIGASRMTVNRALRELTGEGLLRRVHGLGTFVAEPQPHAHLIELRSIADEIKQQGKQHRAEVLQLATIRAEGEFIERMQVAPGTELFHISVVHYQDEIPIQLEMRLVNPAIVPDFIQVDFSVITPTDYLISQLRPDELEHIVQAIMPDKYLESHLAILASEPCLKLRRRTWKDGQIVTAVDMIYPSSRYDLGARYVPS